MLENCRKILAALLVIALLFAVAYVYYNRGIRKGAEHVILNAQPFIVEYVKSPQDTFTLYVDYGEPYGVEEYTAYVC